MDQDRIDTINAVKNQEYIIEMTKKSIDTRKELIAEHIENMQEWLEVEAAKEELMRVRQNMSAKLSSDGIYNDHLEDLAQLKDKLKSEKETLSDLIVGYFSLTKERQMEMTSSGDARTLVIKGSLGKKGKYQTNIFTGSSNE
jgi:predicted RNase H-like nuclease (RuvC/YqgF family)